MSIMPPRKIKLWLDDTRPAPAGWVHVWMARHGKWPDTKPRVHSMNPVGREAMRFVIDRWFDAPRCCCYHRINGHVDTLRCNNEVDL